MLFELIFLLPPEYFHGNIVASHSCTTYYWGSFITIITRKKIGLGTYFVTEGWHWPRIKSAINFQHKPLSNQGCLSQHKL